jgi:hypothetical protein
MKATAKKSQKKATKTTPKKKVAVRKRTKTVKVTKSRPTREMVAENTTKEPAGKSYNFPATTKKAEKPKTLTIENTPQFLAENLYLPAKEFISKDLSSFLYSQLRMKVERGEFITDQQSPDQPAWAGETFLDALLIEQQSKAEELVGHKLYPTYTYARMYNPGAILEAHKDRSSCEVSFTCTLGFEGEPSALFFCKDKKPDEELPAGELTNEEIQKERLKGTPTKMILSGPGDAAAYFGCEAIHWREPVETTRNLAQIFMHYVKKD